MKKIIFKAYKFAKLAHKHQKDDSGKDYFESHIAPVAKMIQFVCPKDFNLIAAAYLHDVIEDCGKTKNCLTEEFNEDVANLVMEVSHEGKKNTAGYYFPRLSSQRAILIKFADRLSNLSRMESWSEKRKEDYLKKSRFWKIKPQKK